MVHLTSHQEVFILECSYLLDFNQCDNLATYSRKVRLLTKERLCILPYQKYWITNREIYGHLFKLFTVNGCQG